MIASSGFSSTLVARSSASLASLVIALAGAGCIVVADDVAGTESSVGTSTAGTTEGTTTEGTTTEGTTTEGTTTEGTTGVEICEPGPGVAFKARLLWPATGR